VLSISNLSVSVNSSPLLRGCNLLIKPGTIHALVGPNGSGKTTLVRAIAGAPSYVITSGTIRLDREKICHLSPDERARHGIFLSFQQPPPIPGLSIDRLLRQSHLAHGNSPSDELQFATRLRDGLKLLALEASFLQRQAHEKLSGGERKKLELLQLFIRRPRLAILDEIDAGLDAATIQSVATALRQLRKEKPDCAMLIISHQQSFLQMLEPNQTSTMRNSTITETKPYGEAAL